MAEFDNENQGSSQGAESTSSESAQPTGDQSQGGQPQSGGSQQPADETTNQEGEQSSGGNEGASEGQESEQPNGQPKLTEKGTKLDPNPESAAHQLLANEKRVRTQMEQVLGNPDLLAKFMETQYGRKVVAPQAEPQVPAYKEYKPEDLESLEDVAKVVNSLQSGFAEKTKSYEDKIAQLEKVVQTLQSGGRAQQVAQKMSEDVNSLKAVPELDPKSPDFIEGLEEDIAQMYHNLDFDASTGSYKGTYSIADIGKRMIEATRKARAKGSSQAQTVVKDKTAGKVVTGTRVKETPGTDNLSPEDSIAQGISKMFR